MNRMAVNLKQGSLIEYVDAWAADNGVVFKAPVRW